MMLKGSVKLPTLNDQTKFFLNNLFNVHILSPSNASANPHLPTRLYHTYIWNHTTFMNITSILF